MKGLLKFSILTSMLVSIGLNAAQPDDDFDAIDALLDKQFAGTDAILERRFEAVEEAVDKAFKGLTKKIEINWGADGLVLPSPHEWVDYSPDMQTRRIMDFEAGILTVETIIQPNQSQKEIAHTLKQAVQSAATDSASDLEKKDQLAAAIKEHLSKQIDSKAPTTSRADSSNTEKPLLKNAISTQQLRYMLKEIESLNTDSLPAAQQTAKVKEDAPSTTKESEKQPKTAKIERKMIQAGGAEAVVVRVQIPFLSDYQNSLIEDNLHVIKKYSKTFDVPVSLILAIIQTESSFNPRATSPIPAFGLMQLVPRTAGIDAYRHVYGEKKIVEPEYLYDPENNIELGVAYFNLLTTRYLRKVNDPLSRFYCAVASYNTGVGNLAKTFTGRKNFNKAARLINEQTPDQIFQFLIEKLPALETRRYLKKVTLAQQKYKQWDEI
ncbi:murein transglycosylase domain-containing protein [Catenovulum sediminis]|uniref:Murein transglycosylase domain-containing protein n=1 Tax=Catenovulum sediminis TaxID=1740262 RepID=A0ABV1RD73_9ALTE